MASGKKTTGNKAAPYIGIAIIALVLWWAFPGCSDTENLQAQKLATIDAGAQVPENDPRVTSISSHLKDLNIRFHESTDTIVAYTIQCHTTLHQHGVQKTFEQILQDMVEDKFEGEYSYKDVITFYTNNKTYGK